MRFIFRTVSVLLIPLFVLSAGLMLHAQQRDRPGQQLATPDTDRITSELTRQTVPQVDFQRIPVGQIIEFVRDRVDFPIVVSDSAETDATVHLKLKQVSLARILKLSLDQSGLTARTRYGVLTILPENSPGGESTRFYDVRDLQLELSSHSGPRLRLRDPDLAGNREKMGTTRFFPKNMNQGGEDGLKTKQGLKRFIRENTGQTNDWNRNGDPIQFNRGLMIVRQKPAVHREIEHLIKRLRQF